jgi:hypothetical protein
VLTRPIGRASIVVGLLLAVGATLTIADAPHTVFGAGVLRRDDIIIPFAAFDEPERAEANEAVAT